jgi:hypothetical protein
MYYAFFRYSLIIALHCTFEMTASCFHNPNVVQESVTVVMVKPCLSKEFIATSYIVGGGGASGYLYQCVNLRGRERKFNPKEDVIFTVTGDAKIDMLWKDDETLVIRNC